MSVCLFVCLTVRLSVSSTPPRTQASQIWQNHKQRHTGVLPILTLIMNSGANAVRILTTLKDGLAPVVLYSFIVSLFLNFALIAQVRGVCVRASLCCCYSLSIVMYTLCVFCKCLTCVHVCS